MFFTLGLKKAARLGSLFLSIMKNLEKYVRNQ